MLKHKTNGGSVIDTSYVPTCYLLVDDDKNIIEFFESTSSISTTVNLFVGGHEECERYIQDNELQYQPVSE